MGGEERAPCSARTFQPPKASYAVATPGRTAAAMARRALATMRPQARSFSSCSCLVMDMGVPSLYYSYFDFASEKAEARPKAISAPPRKHCVVRGGGERFHEAARSAHAESLSQPISAKRTPN